MRNLLSLLFISLIFISCSSSKTPYSPSIIDDSFTHNSLKTPILNKFDLTNSNNPPTKQIPPHQIISQIQLINHSK